MPGVAQLEGLSPPSLCFLREQVGPPPRSCRFPQLGGLSLWARWPPFSNGV